LELSKWLKIYGEICRELGLVPEKDRQAAELLSDVIAGKCLRRDVLSRALVVKSCGSGLRRRAFAPTRPCSVLQACGG
jgi:uncharacterized Rossmann fold enzyme